MLNYRVKCRIFSELSSSKIEFFDFLAVSGIFSVSLGVVTNVPQPKLLGNSLNINKLRKGVRGYRAEPSQIEGVRL